MHTEQLEEAPERTLEVPRSMTRLEAQREGEKIALARIAKPGCKRCLGRGHIGRNVEKDILVPCGCTPITPEEWERAFRKACKAIPPEGSRVHPPEQGEVAMAELPTTKIKNPKGEGYILINDADFDPQTHKRWEEVEQKGAGQTQGKAPETGQKKQGG